MRVAGSGGMMVAVVGIALVALPPLAAQEAGRSGSAAAGAQQDTMTLTLDDALRIAEGQNPDYQKAVNTTRQNGADMRQALFDQVLPRASIGLFNTSYSGNLFHIGSNFYGDPVSRPAATWSYSSSTSQSLQLSWQIQGAGIINALHRQRLTNESRDLSESAQLTTTRIEVRRRYLAALEAQAMLESEQQLLESRRIDQEVTKRLFSLAQGDEVAVLKAELDVQTQTQAVQQQQAAYEKALLNLRTELGDPGLAPFRLDSVALPIFDPSSLQADALVAQALTRAPDVQTARSQVSLAEVAVSDAQSSWWPTLSISASLARTNQATQNDALFNPSWKDPADKRFSLSLSFPMLNDFFGTRKQQVSASVALDNARQDQRKQRLTTEQNVRSDLLDLRSRWASLQVAESSAQIAAKALDLARQQYRIGSIDFQTLRTSVNDDATARRQLITARQDFVTALLSLEQAVGEPIGPDAAPGGDAPGGL